MAKVDRAVRKDRRSTLEELHECFPEISRSIIHEIVSETIPSCQVLQEDHGLCFLGQKGILLIDFLPQGETINASRHCETLKQLRRVIQSKRRGMLTCGVCRLHDNARPHVARSTTELLDQFGWDAVAHPPHSLDLAPSDFRLFTKMKEGLAGELFTNDEEVKEAATNWTKVVAGSFYEERISKSRYTNCIEVSGDYVEK
jgi:hypothetical protein